MELREYLKIIGKRIWILIVCIIIITLASYFISKIKPVTYEGTFSTSILVVDPTQTTPQTDDNYFKYDDYYAWQTSSIFADNVISWLKDPAYVSQIYSNANIDVPTDKLKDYSRLLISKKNNPSVVQVNYRSLDQFEVQSLLEQSKKFIAQKTQNWLDKGLIENIAIDSGEPIIIASYPQTGFNTLVGLVAGIVLGLLLIFFTEYMKREK